MPGHSGEIDDSDSHHPEADELVDYVRGELSQQRAQGVRLHAAGCVDCGDQLAALILLRERHLNAEGAGDRKATVTPVRFPVAVPPPAAARRWPLAAAAAAAAAAVLLVAPAWLLWPAPPGQPTDEDRFLVLETAAELEFFVAPGTAAASAGSSEEVAIGLALRDIVQGDLQTARGRLEPFRKLPQWDRFGTALLGYVLFLQQDPGARTVLEMYGAGHDKQAWEADAVSPEDLAFFFLARLRLADGDEAGAREAAGWIDPRMGAGPVAAKWRQEILGDATGVESPDSSP